MNSDTERFIETAKEDLKRHFANPWLDPTALQQRLARLEGKCGACGKALSVTEAERGEHFAAFKFAGGHTVFLEEGQESISIDIDFAGAAVGITPDGKQSIQAGTSGEKQGIKEQEMEVTRRFASWFRPELTKFHKERKNGKDEEDSPVDIIGESADRTCRELFQLTRLYGTDFWRTLNTTSTADLLTGGIVSLVEQAIERKIHFDPKQKRQIILLIDVWPGVAAKFVAQIKAQLAELLNTCGFKEVWLVGLTKEQSFRLWPQGYS